MIYSIGACTIDTDTYELRRDGNLVPVEPKVFDLLVFLLDNADRVVTKDEIIERVWHGRIVSDATISTRIKFVRKAIGDDGTRQKLIRTIRGRGFRVVESVEQGAAPTKYGTKGTQSPEPSSRAERSLPLPDKPSIAVLPFSNLSSDIDQQYFAEGITDDIITGLSKFRSLFVITRHSSFAFDANAADLTDVSNSLGVRYVVQGNVRRSASRLRITARLIEPANDRLMWAERYDRDIQDIFTIQDDVTHAIVSAIEPQLASSERHRARHKPPEDLGAWESYQRAMWHLYQYNAEDIDTALELLRRAVDLDAAFASAHAGLSFALYYKAVLGFSDDAAGDLAVAREAGITAVRLDETDPFAHVALGRVNSIKGDHDAAIAACDTAISLNPSYANAHFGRAHSLWQSGRAKEALASHDEAIRLSPRDPILWAFTASKAIALIILGRYEEALDWSVRALLQPNAAILAHLPKISALYLLGRETESGKALEEARQIKPDLSIAWIGGVLPITDQETREIFLGSLRNAGIPD